MTASPRRAPRSAAISTSSIVAGRIRASTGARPTRPISIRRSSWRRREFSPRAGRDCGRATPSLRHAQRANIPQTINPGRTSLISRGRLFRQPEPAQFDVELFIVHPTFDPAEISAALGLDAKFSHRVGEQRKTPKGTPLEGTYRDTRWRHSRRHETPDQWFADKVAELLDRIEPHRGFLKKLRDTGGRACVIVQFLGDGYFGDEIPQETLTKLADLELDLGIECFT